MELNSDSYLKKLLIPIGGLLFIILISLLLVIPRVKKVKKQFHENEKIVQSKKDFLAKAQLVSTLSESDLDHKAELSNLAMPKEKDISLILYALNEPVRNNDFYTDQLEFNLGEVVSGSEEAREEELKSTKKPIDQIPAVMRVLGSGEKLSSLIEDMENVLPVISLTEVRASYSEAGRVTANFNFYLSVSSRLPSFDPEKLSLKDLTISDEEEKLLVRLDGFEKAGISSILTSQDLVPVILGRDNPFSLSQ
ncbi:MAG: hypothetical protein ABIB61_00225 [Candidatus Shapirobacteria bacterium]